MGSNSLAGQTPPRRAMRVREAVGAYRISKTKLYALMKSGQLPSVRVGGTRLILIEGLEALLVGSPTPPS